MNDKIFTKPIKKQFEFDEEVAAVFDDMLQRSVPFYKESQKITEFFALKQLENGGIAYDLGCSTATLLINISRKLKCKAVLIGLDNSEAMLEQARKKCEAFNANIELVNADILEYEYKEAELFISNYTLQFIRPLIREELVKKISASLKKDGVFIFSEKVISHHPKLNKDLIECYYDFKKEQGYSEYEIMQKREALENVLVPYSEDENIKMAKNCGFSHCEVVFRWANFATFIAIK
ncbi:MAG: carboxy-S-adenosyl-L-methionine synthase CmoA [Sulfurimonas sp. RIFCSPLOWO2_12_FULL_36_74]|uniref:carboxy-S-adenosyl-L-methionine synthase CmoA n=1 Tax=Sulfurimonas sp. RIFCSPLOWO2_12_36_12 TaxID=1802253 RepID=UPI0008BDEDD4|nr:carboxy-S-adenosyl-L-methionine synthase CmoA [Sulfurimonas sp. RIFCSPLOWO2_12_36_12]OHD99981.1 MAG: carboxy-S-adenosyl-L-methionine synthase CmoA [Sulfurimonas sp. RIFCSPLOWO2_02_FULL_36_28]OHE01164.1 MAG: carboxy-S-adenosyl-L-methionine synthase CmoA [Sulfurimonas sp. RIFCSPLOWO2_12_36_12]OHE05994.1 MAG: carboxy-S-adenosyl-L-methionine synthase CmoA [Sulfurimonas sp. RIFCSPLOWO2_12_FULL_36_74]